MRTDLSAQLDLLGGGGGVVIPSVSPYERFLILPYVIMFFEKILNDLLHFKHLSLLPPPLISSTIPPSMNILIVH